jgi:hypothetical protein
MIKIRMARIPIPIDKYRTHFILFSLFPFIKRIGASRFGGFLMD